MKIYCDLSIQFNRIEQLLQLSLKNNLLNNIEFTNNIYNCDLILLLVNSSNSLINLGNTTKLNGKFKQPKINPKYQDTMNQILSNRYNIRRIDYFKLNKPIIIIERLDSAVTWVRDYPPNVIAVIKNRVARDPIINNSKLYCGRYHGTLITDGLKKKLIQPILHKKGDIGYNFFKDFKKLKEINEENLKKIHSVLWDYNSSPIGKSMKFFKNASIPIKDIDVFCVHTIRPGIIGEHRKKAIDIVSNLKKLKVFTEKCNNNIYNKMFIRSKICIACWGFGEWTHMDGYAMYSKTILIKPNTDHVKMDPDIYNSKRYIPCKPDFSDLKDIINNVLKNYEKYNDMLEDNLKFIKSKSDIEYAKDFWNKIQEIYNNNT